MYPVKPKGENDDEETLRTDSKIYQQKNRLGSRHDHIEGQPSFGPVHNL